MEGGGKGIEDWREGKTKDGRERMEGGREGKVRKKRNEEGSDEKGIKEGKEREREWKRRVKGEG